MKVFLDTNALIDLIVERHPERHRDMVSVVRLCDAYDHSLWISAQSLCDFTYTVLNSKPLKSLVPHRATREQLVYDAREAMLDDFGIYETNRSLLLRAHHNTQEPDFEDALIAEAARRVNADMLISSDQKAFNQALIPKFTPAQAVRYLMNHPTP